jgi:hypothetical protein
MIEDLRYRVKSKFCWRVLSVARRNLRGTSGLPLMFFGGLFAIETYANILYIFKEFLKAPERPALLFFVFT